MGARNSILPASSSTYSGRFATRRLVDLVFFFFIIFFIVLGLGIRFVFVFQPHPFFSHTINISNDQTLILDIIGRRTRYVVTF